MIRDDQALMVISLIQKKKKKKERQRVGLHINEEARSEARKWPMGMR